MEWHKASVWAEPDRFDRDHPARKLVLGGRRLTRSPLLFQCAAWQLAFYWLGPNKARRGVTTVHVCWQPPAPPPPSYSKAPLPPPPCLSHQAAPSSRRPICLCTLGQSLTFIMEGHCSCQMDVMTQSIGFNTGDSSGMLGMRAVCCTRGASCTFVTSVQQLTSNCETNLHFLKCFNENIIYICWNIRLFWETQKTPHDITAVSHWL